MKNGSPRLRLNTTDIKKTARDALIILLAGIATSMIAVIPEVSLFLVETIKQNPNITPILIPILTSLVGGVAIAIRKFLTDYTKKS